MSFVMILTLTGLFLYGTGVAIATYQVGLFLVDRLIEAVRGWVQQTVRFVAMILWAVRS